MRSASHSTMFSSRSSLDLLEAALQERGPLRCRFALAELPPQVLGELAVATVRVDEDESCSAGGRGDRHPFFPVRLRISALKASRPDPHHVLAGDKLRVRRVDDNRRIDVRTQPLQQGDGALCGELPPAARS